MTPSPTTSDEHTSAEVGQVRAICACRRVA